jgi:hypothetical protein
MVINYPDFIRKCLIAIGLSVYVPLLLYSQESGSCAENLRTAQSLFDKGQVEQVPSLLEECMKSGFTREESLLAYKLLIQSFLFEDKLEQADSTMMEFLKKNPEYVISPTDHSSFVHLYNNFVVKPVVQIAVHLGTSQPFIFKSDDSHSLAGEPGDKQYKSGTLNLYTSIEAKFKINNKLDLNIETGYSQITFKNSEIFMVFEKNVYKETQKRLEIPVSLSYNFNGFGKLTPYARLGVGPALTLIATSSASSTPTDSNNPFARTGNDNDRKDSRIEMDMLVQAGAGIKFKTRGGFFFTELRSNFGIYNQTIRRSSSEKELNWYYFIDDDDFWINTVNLNVGYTQIFYKPSKRK